MRTTVRAARARALTAERSPVRAESAAVPRQPGLVTVPAKNDSGSITSQLGWVYSVRDRRTKT